MKKSLSFITVAVFCLLMTACQSGWQIDLHENGTPIGLIDHDLVNFYIEKVSDGAENIQLAHLLFHQGFTLIDEIQLIMDGKIHQAFDWENIAEKSQINNKGEVIINGVAYSPVTLNISPSPLAAEINLSIMDLAPTMAKVLGLPELPDAYGQPQSEIRAQHGVLILLDGLQYQKLITLINQGALPFFGEINTIHKGLTVYPSITTASTGALLTGAPPYVNGVVGYGYRSTESKTLFDLAVEMGRSVTAVEGYSLAFGLQNAEVILSGDRDGDGFTDDNVLRNSLRVIGEEMPDLLFIHFHDVDDMGHSYGPDSPEYEAAIIRVDGYLAQIYHALPENTFITIFADHGMQNDSLSSGGNHGQLTKSAMIIPIIFMEK
ncbi:MAG: alkaline phosphatase family protein [Brevefilum sp.]|nr:alkaline phosphatase family protein [Brevefilum sp.]